MSNRARSTPTRTEVMTGALLEIDNVVPDHEVLSQLIHHAHNTSSSVAEGAQQELKGT